jgi:hypothetical protein
MMSTSLETIGGPQGAASSDLPLVERRSENMPLTFTLLNRQGESVFYAEETVNKTLDALRADILNNLLPYSSHTSVRSKSTNGKFITKEGTLLKCALKYGKLADLYMPVRRRSLNGTWIGIVAGVLIYLLGFGFILVQVNPNLGLAMIALPISAVVFFFLERAKIKVQPPLSLIPVAIPAYLGWNGMFGALIGAAVSAALLSCMPGMAIGAIVGTIQRKKLVLAPDAPQENVVLRIGIPFCIAVAYWIAYFTYAPQLLAKILEK